VTDPIILIQNEFEKESAGFFVPDLFDEFFDLRGVRFDFGSG
jgi:hypothetical protein